ncbi:hypothetical protein GYMLUDRAFT_42624 [Collybiopsis luxurians FD-317 M1]|uniref:GATA-type domain-containing protein n=1 Tax=Collybiopsis luxurians FD-317 M1 TaxID=944289 RepID=A0A0D0C086_9AGAR|nr:hypothetical protein GYMLUDRAFT_42624 [Collybiopsis luxurians FD-317 M1]
MQGSPRRETIFALRGEQLDLTTHAYPGRSYSSASNSTTEYWNHASSSQNGAVHYDPQRQTPLWSNGSIDNVGSHSSYHRGVNAYDTSLRRTDLGGRSIYSSDTAIWPAAQIPSQWSEFNQFDSSFGPWIPEEESKHIITHHTDSPLSAISSPSPSPSPIQSYPAPNSTSKSKAGTNSNSGKTCSHCHATSTPLWRREPSTLRTLCNACGLYLQQRNKLRPQELIDADHDDESEISDHEGTGPQCSHCFTRNTSVWRRSNTGAQLCNACGVYARLRGKDRPLSLRRKKIKPRTKHAKPSA